VSSAGGAVATWGTTPEERGRPFPCDALVPRPEEALFRGVSVEAAAPVVFRWLCQLRVAPYSYDWLDNYGRRSPRTLTPKLDQLAVGQEVMRIFRLAEFAPDDHLTLLLRRASSAWRTFGDLAVTYRVVPESGARCRLLVKLVVRYPPGLWGALMRRVLPFGDLVMMRKQLRTLKRLAEKAPPSSVVGAASRR
jgi:hypothetical protein